MRFGLFSAIVGGLAVWGASAEAGLADWETRRLNAAFAASGGLSVSQDDVAAARIGDLANGRVTGADGSARALSLTVGSCHLRYMEERWSPKGAFLGGSESFIALLDVARFEAGRGAAEIAVVMDAAAPLMRARYDGTGAMTDIAPHQIGVIQVAKTDDRADLITLLNAARAACL